MNDDLDKVMDFEPGSTAGDVLDLSDLLVGVSGKIVLVGVDVVTGTSSNAEIISNLLADGDLVA